MHFIDEGINLSAVSCNGSACFLKPGHNLRDGLTKQALAGVLESVEARRGSFCSRNQLVHFTSKKLFFCYFMEPLAENNVVGGKRSGIQK